VRRELNSSWGVRTLLLKASLAASTTRHLAGRDGISCSATMIRNHETPQHTTIFAPRALMKSGMIFEQCVVGGVSSLRDLSTMGWGSAFCRTLAHADIRNGGLSIVGGGVGISAGARNGCTLDQH